MSHVLRALAVCSAVLAAGCASSVCDRSAALASKVSECPQAVGHLLAPTATCATRVLGCSAQGQAALTRAVECLEKLGTCSAADQATWLSGQAACLDPLATLEQACADAVFGGTPPGSDGGADGGAVDAGRQPLDGGAVELIAVADETSFALAWAATQQGQAARWELDMWVDGGRVGELSLTPGSRRAHYFGGAVPLLADGGAGPSQARSFFVVGLLNDGTVVLGAEPDAGGGPTFSCAGPQDCSTDKVCDLGQCKQVACDTSNPACPTGYACPTGICVFAGDAGVRDAGQGSGGTFVAAPFISNLAQAATGKPAWAAPVIVGGFAARRPSMVAIDSARQFVALEQENQPVGHYTVRRGRELLNDLGSSSVIDTVGDHVKVTYVPESDTIFACYNVGRGVRVRRSRDHGRTWGSDALTIEPVADGGFNSRYHSCDIAPWRNGSAILVHVEDDALVVKTVTEALSLASTDYAFLSGPTDGGGFNSYNPVHPAIATVPDAGVVHVVFAASRVLGGGSDLEIYDTYRTAQTGAFSQPLYVNRTSATNGTAGSQDWPTVAVDPTSLRAVAAYTSLETTGSGTIHTVYLSMFTPGANEWTTGSDLTVLAYHPGQMVWPLFPARQLVGGEVWDAFSPTLAANPDGKIWLGLLAGKRGSPKNDYRPYAVRFDFDQSSQLSNAKGWFVAPAEPLLASTNPTQSVDPRISGQPMPTISTLAVDPQLSVYGAFVEALGQFNELENRAVYVSRP